MFKFTLKLIAFLFPLFLIVGVWEYKSRFIESGYGKKRQIAEQNIETAQLMVLGNSHTYGGINTHFFNVPSLNLAFPAQDLYYDSRILLKYLPRAKNLKLVIISVSYPSLEAGKLEDTTYGWRTPFYSRFWHIPSQSQDFKLEDYSSIALFGNEASRNYLLTNRPPEIEMDIRMDDAGNNAKPESSNFALVIDAGKMVEQYQSMMNEDNIPQNLQILTEMVQALKERDIKVRMITTPCFHTFYERINPQKYAVMQDTLIRFSRNHNVEYHNYLKDPRFTEVDFVNSTHLTTQGSQKFTLILKDEILEKYQ